MSSDKVIRLFYPLSRKTIDTYTVIRFYYPNSEIRINVSGVVESFLSRLIYRKVLFDRGIEGIVLPQEVNVALNGKVNCLHPGRDMVKSLNDKDAFDDVCRSNQILVPKTWNEDFLLNEPTKLIFKPKIGAGSRGIKIIECDRGLVQVQKDYICQEYLGNDNKIYGFFAFAVKGKVQSSYCHERIETYPKKGGVSVLSKLYENEKLHNTACDVVRKLNYTGLLMIEFKHYQNKFYVIEINPRLWGSVLFCLSIKDNPVTSYLNHRGLKKPTREALGREFLVWLFPYGLFRRNVYKHLSKALLINYGYDSARANYFTRVLVTILAKVVR